MSSSKDLSQLSVDELSDFLNSFDNVICDCDGVVFFMYQLIDGVKESISSLKSLGKQIVYVTNNNGITRETMATRMTSQGISVVADDIINPSRAIVDYLKEIKFDKKVFLISLPGLRADLEDAGFEIANSAKAELVDNTVNDDTLESLLHCDKDVGAVVVCLDFNMTYGSLNRAFRYIYKNPDVHFINTGYNQKIMLCPNELILGPSYFHDILKDATNTKPITLGKPSEEFGKYIDAKLGFNPKKTLFIGDSAEHDVGFGNSLGYQTLLVLTGTSKLTELETCVDNWKPTFYVNSLGDVHGLIKKIIE